MADRMTTSRLKTKELFPKLRADKGRSMADRMTTSRLKTKELFPKLRADKGRSMADRMTTSRLKKKERTPSWTQSEMVLRHVLSPRHVFVAMLAAMPARFVTNEIVTDKSCRQCTVLMLMSVRDIYIETEREKGCLQV